MTARRVAIVGAGWAGIAAAVHARRAGHEVTLFEMAPDIGGRARAIRTAHATLDNGQHILIGAYHATLELMRLVGADPATLLHRQALALPYPDGSGLRLPAGAPVPSFVRGLWANRGWSRGERLALLRATAGWAWRGFRCDTTLTVARLCVTLPRKIRAELIEPLCVAALNTPAEHASASVFLRVLRDALFSGAGSADLLLPRADLSTLLPTPATTWFARHGVALVTARRVGEIDFARDRWQLDGAAFERIVLACSAREAARLTSALAPSWSAVAGALQYEPIVTVYLRCAGARLPAAMTVLHASAAQPAQFAFDLGALGGAGDLFAFVISGARAAVTAGLQRTAQTVLAQVKSAFPAGTWPREPTLVHVAAEKRATFACTPALRRPDALVAPGLLAAGDYIAGPYPATLEGAVRSGRDAAARLAGA